MAAVIDFAQDLWTSILTPGTTPALIKATHFSFAALLATLAFLLVATRNIHFVFLTIIASGLWAAITWFIKEVELEKQRQQQQQQSKEEQEEKTDDRLEDKMQESAATAVASEANATVRSRKV
jgi:flagellar biosynthesis component FlhA